MKKSTNTLTILPTGYPTALVEIAQAAWVRLLLERASQAYPLLLPCPLSFRLLVQVLARSVVVWATALLAYTSREDSARCYTLLHPLDRPWTAFPAVQLVGAFASLAA